MDIREQLARDLLSAPYSELSQQKKSVIDLIADQKPTGLGFEVGGTPWLRRGSRERGRHREREHHGEHLPEL
jgi:hypothetical protein